MAGSPLRMRGKDVACCDFSGSFGITPAYAGKRNFRIQSHVAKKDHPCVCGEKAKALVVTGLR